MPRPRLTPDVALEIHIRATCSRHQFDADPADCLEQLQHIAGHRPDFLARVASDWVRDYRGEYTHRLCDGLLSIPGARQHAE